MRFQLPSIQIYTKLPGILRSRTVGIGWIVALVFIVFLFWQQVAGWPFTLKMEVPYPKGTGLQAVRLPSGYPAFEWHNAMVRVSAQGKQIPRYSDKDALRTATTPGFSVKERHVQLRGGGEIQNVAHGPWIVEVPRVMKLSRFLVCCLGFTLTTILLIRSRNTVVSDVCGQIRAWFTNPGIPWHAWGLTLLAATAAIGIRAWGFSFPNWANDTPTYFESIFAVAAGAKPMATPDRPFAYPLIMGSILRAIPDLRAIVAAHSFASLCAAASIGAVIWWTSSTLWRSPIAKSFGRILAVVTGGAFALNETILEREWALLSEAWVALFLGFQAILSWLLTSRQRSLAMAVGLYALFCAGGMLALFTRANWGFAIALLPLPWIIAVWLNSSSYRDMLRWSASGIVVLTLVLGSGFAYQAHCTVQEPSESLYYRARALVCWHVPLIRPEIDRRLERQLDDPLRPVLVEMAQVMDRELALSKVTGPGSYPTLGYDADRLFFSGLPAAPLFSRLKVADRTSLCTNLFVEAFKRNPEVYAGKVLGQIALLFSKVYKAPKIPVQLVKEALEKSRKAAETSPIIPFPIARNYAVALQDAQVNLAKPWPSAGRIALSTRACVIFDALRATFAWALALPIIVCSTVVCWPRMRRAIHWRSLAPALCTAIWAAGSVVLSALSSAVTQGLDVQRYIELSMPLALLSHVLWPLIACTVIADVVRELRPGYASEHTAFTRKTAVRERPTSSVPI